MTLSRWFWLVGLMVGLGCLQVAQRNAIFLKGYAIAHRLEQAHGQQTRMGWLSARVTGLSSPEHLFKEADARRLNLVAWSPLTPTPRPNGLAASSAMRVASIHDDDAPVSEDTAD